MASNWRQLAKSLEQVMWRTPTSREKQIMQLNITRKTMAGGYIKETLW